MFLDRDLYNTLIRFSKFPVVGVFGPRQSGKTTLVKNVFSNYKYLNFEDPNTRDFALKDPKSFLKQNENDFGIILDEFQYVPQILSYIQIEVDEKKRKGYFILTGSQNFLMNQPITQSLAGRIGILTLLPLSIKEIQKNNLAINSAIDLIFKGGYPRLFTEDFTPEEFYPSYIHSYAERDVRQLINVENLRTFRKFMQLCAGRVGQLLNISELAMNCGINQRTAEKWISILEASYIIFLLTPHHNNFNKRIIKTPKIYFYDSGLACSLLTLKSTKELELSVFKGHLFENLIISDFYKQFYNLGLQPSLYFWRDKNGSLEIDCIIDKGTKLIPIEIKSSSTITDNFFNNLYRWNELAEQNILYLVYTGDNQKRKDVDILNWKMSGDLINQIYKDNN